MFKIGINFGDIFDLWLVESANEDSKRKRADGI
jgi:hypothetical protein